MLALNKYNLNLETGLYDLQACIIIKPVAWPIYHSSTSECVDEEVFAYLELKWLFLNCAIPPPTPCVHESG